MYSIALKFRVINIISLLDFYKNTENPKGSYVILFRYLFCFILIAILIIVSFNLDLVLFYSVLFLIVSSCISESFSCVFNVL